MKELLLNIFKIKRGDILYVLRMIFGELFYRHSNLIALCLSLTAAYLLHVNNIYQIHYNDAPGILALLVAVFALVIAENQYHSWKQERLLDRLENIYIALREIQEDFGPVEQNGPWTVWKREDGREFTDEDIGRVIEVISSWPTDIERIKRNCTKTIFEIRFAKKLIRRRSFILHPTQTINITLNRITTHCYQLQHLVSTCKDVAEGKVGLGAGTGKSIIDNYWSSCVELNSDRKGNHSLEHTAPASMIMTHFVNALVENLRI